MSNVDDALLAHTFTHLARQCRDSLPPRPQASADGLREGFDIPLADAGRDPVEVIDQLVAAAEPGLVGNTGRNFFGWVMGASTGVGVAAELLTASWGQNAAIYATAPSAAIAEEVAARWLLELLELPRESSVAFTTGATMASWIGLAAARSEVLRRVGWDFEADGFAGAPPIEVIVSDEAHASVLAVLRYLGFGDRSLVRVPTDIQGRIRPAALDAALARVNGPCLVVAQAGHIHSGAVDPLGPISELAHARDAWLHVDGAFGLWARTTRTHRDLAKGAECADSWAVDGHKWLQVPYDSGYAIVRDEGAHRRALGQSASYLEQDSASGRNPSDYGPELSRRARGFATWAVLQARGRCGIAALVERHCRCARVLAQRLAREPGIQVLNNVHLNQLAVTFTPGGGGVHGSGLSETDYSASGSPRNRGVTDAVIAALQDENRAFVAGADWKGWRILRVSIIAEQTDVTDVERLAQSIIAAWRHVQDAARLHRLPVDKPNSQSSERPGANEAVAPGSPMEPFQTLKRPWVQQSRNL